MALLTSCWFIIESIIIPDGFLKWFYLSFYIHPVFLFSCQIFLWLNLLKGWILVVIFYPLRIIYFLGLYMFRFFRDFCVMYIFSSSINDADQNLEQTVKSQVDLQLQIFNLNRFGFSSSCTKTVLIPSTYKLMLIECPKREPSHSDDFEGNYVNIQESSLRQPDDNHITSLDHEYVPAKYVPANVCYSESSIEEDDDVVVLNNECDPPSLGLMVLKVERDEAIREQKWKIPSEDAFYTKYTERMRWFDVLNIDRTTGISAIADNNFEIPGAFGSNDSTAYFSWRKQAKKRLLKSLESDLEMVYVAQTSLSWEALHYQYTKVKALADSAAPNGVFYDDAGGEFQKFHVLLDRFMENERCEGKRSWSYVHGRFALKSLLQVPQISGFVEEEKEDMEGEEAIGVKEVLKAIEKCIHAFWVFLRTDNKKKAWWKPKGLLWDHSSAENPRDLKLLDDVTRKLQKKEKMLKDLQGKKRDWFKKVADFPEENQTKEILFTIIEMKLVSRVLQMNSISTSQLQWCQEKLDSVDFKDGNIFRTRIAPLLFPPS